MKGYKATYNMKCLGLTYEVGKTYTIDNIKMCSYGFHFCQEMKDVIGYYKYNDNFVLLEVEALGKTETSDDKTVTNKLKVIGIVPKDQYTFKLPIITYDDRNNKLSYENTNGYKEFYTYDDRNNKLSYEDSNGYKEFYTYDDRNNILSYENTNGYKTTYTYDDRNNKLSYDSNGYKRIYTYDDRNNKLSYEDSDGLKIFYTYDDRNNMLSYDASDVYKITYTYDDRNNMLSENTNGRKWKITID